jgi:plastocyanin
MRILKILAVAASGLVLALGAAACGGDDDDEETTAAEEASAETVNVTGDDFSFELSATPTAETQEITFENIGEEDHELIFAKINEGYTLQDAIEAEGRKGTAEQFRPILFAKPGETAKRSIEIKEPLEPGNYAMVCAIPYKGDPHYDLGMQTEFAVD